MNVSEKMEHFDVAIIGLGPAGSALARKLAGKMQVIALDKSTSVVLKVSANLVAVCWHRTRSVLLFAMD